MALEASEKSNGPSNMPTFVNRITRSYFGSNKTGKQCSPSRNIIQTWLPPGFQESVLGERILVDSEPTSGLNEANFCPLCDQLMQRNWCSYTLNKLETDTNSHDCIVLLPDVPPVLFASLLLAVKWDFAHMEPEKNTTRSGALLALAVFQSS